MQNETTATIHNVGFIDYCVRLFTSNLAGVSSGAYGTTVHLDNGYTNDDIANVQALFAGANSLSVNTDKNTITADDTDTATITLSTAESSINYYVTLDNLDYASGHVTPSSGTATLELSTSLTGNYRVYMINPDGINAGHVDITAE